VLAAPNGEVRFGATGAEISSKDEIEAADKAEIDKGSELPVAVKCVDEDEIDPHNQMLVTYSNRLLLTAVHGKQY